MPPIFRGESLTPGFGAVNPFRVGGRPKLTSSPTAHARQERSFESDPASNGLCMAEVLPVAFTVDRGGL